MIQISPFETQLSSEAKGAVDGILDQFDGLDEKTKKKFANAVYGALEGLEGFDELKDPAKEGVDEFLESLRSALDEHSPSKKTEEIFTLAMDGAANGVEAGKENVLTKAGEFVSAFLNVFTSGDVGKQLESLGNKVMSYFGIGVSSKTKDSASAGKANADAANKGAGSVSPITTGQSIFCKIDKFGTISYQAHMRGIGWGNWQSDGLMVGSTGQNRRIEALHIKPNGETDVVIHMKGTGNKEYKNITKDTLLGTVGQNRRLEAIRITGKESFYLYRVHQKSIGWSEWANNGEWAGTTGKGLQMEALQIKKSMFSVEPHVQSKGWLSPKAAENVIGITGHALRLEAIRINPYGKTIKAKAHIQSKGWVDYGTITKDTIIGTVGEKKRIECLCFDGDFEYRVHIQGSGWTDWTKADGVATLGTVGQELRIEAIQFR